MEAVILSGGLGTRLRPLTYTRPKPLLPVANRPMVEHLIDRLPERVDRAIIAAGYKIEQIRDWAEALDHRVDIIVVNEEEPLGTGGAIKNVENEITGPFLCFNGDVLSSAPLEKMAQAREKQDAMGALSLWEVDEPQHYGVVDMDENKILRFVEKPDPGTAPSNLINAGTYCFHQALLDYIPQGEKTSLEYDVFPKALDDGETFIGVPFTGHWVDTGRPDVYLRAHELLLEGEAAVHEEARMKGAWRTWASVGAGCTVHEGSTLARSVLLEDVTVHPGAHVTDSILGANVTVGKDADLTRCVVADNETIPPGATLTDEMIGVDPERPVGGDD